MFKIKFAAMTLFTLMIFGNAWATPFGTNITIYDGNSSQSSGWYSDREDNEVEPGMQIDQKWDLEGFFMKDKTLSIVGGYNFRAGVYDPNDARAGSNFRWTGGDIFISTGQKPSYGDIHSDLGNGIRTVDNSYGYDYVLDIRRGEMTYTLRQIDENTRVNTPYFDVNEGSSPWLYRRGGTELSEGEVAFDTVDVDDLFLGDTHYAMSIDLSYLYALLGSNGLDLDLYFHYTMECGNDNLMGHYKYSAPVPEPATMLLLGTGLIGIAGLGRRKFRK